MVNVSAAEQTFKPPTGLRRIGEWLNDLSIDGMLGLSAQELPSVADNDALAMMRAR